MEVDACSVLSDADSAAAGPRLAPEVRLEVPGGVLVFYPKDGRFTAECGNPLHGRCVATRFNRPRSRMQGRPCGFLAAWLAGGALAEDRRAHWVPMIADVEADLAMRQEHRRLLLAMDGGDALLRRERNSEAGLEHEPAAP